MATFEQHCAEALQTFGKPHAEVHLWLDEFAGKQPYGMRHRKKRHHLAGIEEVRNLWGNEAAEAARQHIFSDLKLEGCGNLIHFRRMKAITSEWVYFDQAMRFASKMKQQQWLCHIAQEFGQSKARHSTKKIAMSRAE